MLKKTVVAICLLTVTIMNASQIIIPEKGWLVNDFRIKENGARLSFEKAPDGSNALIVDFYGSKCSNISMDSNAVKEQAKNWPQTFNGLNGYFWNDGKLTKLVFAFRINTKTQFVGFVKMDHKGWKQLKINRVINFQDKGMKLQPNKLFSIFFRCSNRNEFKTGLASLSWEEKGTELYKEPLGNRENIIKTSISPRIDGMLDDPIWKTVKPLLLKHQAINKDQEIKNSSWFKAAWDDDNFYIAASMAFPKGTKLKADMKNHDDPLWENDDFEFMLYPEPDQRKFYQFMVNPANTKTDIARIFDQVADQIKIKYKDWNGKWTVRTKVFSDHWTVEAAVPWKTIGADKVPQIIQFQALRTDKSINPVQYSIWSPVKRKPTEGFGFLNPVENNKTPVCFSDISVKRLVDGKIIVNGAIKADSALGDVKITAWYNSPYSPPEKFTMPLKCETSTKTFNWKIPIKASVNGYHQFVIKAIGKDLNSGCTLYSFNQTLPSTVKFSDVLLNPVPKEMKFLKEVFTPKQDDIIGIPAKASKRTEKTASFLAKKIYALYGVKLPIKRGANSRIQLSVKLLKKPQATGPDSAEAYNLKITSKKIFITGHGEAGLYYGAVTLAQLAAAPKQPNTPIKCVNISDYPTFASRVVCLYEMGHCKKATSGRGYSVKKIKDWIQRYVAGSKLNVLSWGFADNVNYPSLKELHRPNNFTPEDIREICDYAREHFVQIMPGVLFGAHSIFWTKHYPGIIEKKFGPHQFDISNPKVYELMEKLFTDIVNMCGKPITHFNTMNDEWWHGKRTVENNLLNGKTRKYWFEKFLLAEYEIINKLGLKMAMFDDMLLQKHNGEAPFDLYKVTEKLPRDIVMLSWSDSNEPMYKLGFKQCWRVDNGFSADFRKPFPQTTGFGTIKYPFIDSMFNHTLDVKWLKFCFQTQLQCANYAWNREARGVLPMTEWTMQNMPNLMGTYNTQPNPSAGNKLTQVDIFRDEKIAANLKLKPQAEIGNIPMKIGAIEITPDKAYKIELSTADNISSVYILSNCDVKNKADISQLRKQVKSSLPYGIIVAKYVLNYADGTKTEMPVRLGRSISLLKFTDPQTRYIKESRAVYPLATDQLLALNQFELINPYPERPVASIEIESINKLAPVLLCAVTIRNTK
jgi:glycosyl hydrolase family 20/cellulose/xylan binding protein with CBM9 domain